MDDHPDLDVVDPIFRDFGGVKRFSGAVVTLKLHEDNSLVRATLTEPGEGRVLVVDGGGSLRCALVGDNLATLAVKNGWSGILVYGAIRDSAEINEIKVGLKALTTNPRKSIKREVGQRDLVVRFGGVSFHPGHYLYADEDGIVLSPKELKI